jgi:hypothetical protein
VKGERAEDEGQNDGGRQNRGREGHSWGVNSLGVDHIPYNHIGRRPKKCVRVCSMSFHVALFDEQEYLCFVVASHLADAPQRCGALGSPREPRYETHVHT